MLPKISVVIPAYNCGGSIENTARSVFNQTHAPHELIIVDDASNGSTKEIFRSIARSSATTCVIINLPKNSGGPSEPLNIGISAATGEWIATLDHDDRMMPERLKTLSRCLAKDDHIGLVFSNFFREQNHSAPPSVIDRGMEIATGLEFLDLGQTDRKIPAQTAHAKLLEHNFVLTCSNFLFPKRVWEVCGGFDTNLRASCDHDFLLNVTSRFDLGFADQPLCSWTLHPESLAQQATRTEKIKETIYILEKYNCRELSEEVRRKIKLNRSQEYFDLGYAFRQKGFYREALLAYGKSRPLRQSLWSIGKLLPHWFFHGRKQRNHG